ncbi:MAG: hypothetical protein ACRCY3_00415 [Sphingorhabdus sp.]
MVDPNIRDEDEQYPGQDSIENQQIPGYGDGGQQEPNLNEDDGEDQLDIEHEDDGVNPQ